MSYAIDLNARQSARTLEQAIRQQAEAILEPRVWGDGHHLHCRLEPHSNPLNLDRSPVVTLAALSQTGAVPALTDRAATDPAAADPAAARPESSPSIQIEDIRELVGTYVDAVLHLGEQRYMFSTDVIRVLPGVSAGDSPRLHVSRPPVLQVAQRRRFRRITLSHAAQVELRWIRDDLHMGGVGWLFNVSGDGMACRTEARVAESLWIGDELQVEFTLAPGDTERFSLSGILCNKTPAGTLGKIILGIHFQTEEPQAAATAQQLRQRLIERASQLAATQKGVDS